MIKWDEYFIIESSYTASPMSEDGDWDVISDWQYHIKVISSGEIVGTYKDYMYAAKQAKYKFKKITEQVEKLLLG